MTQSATFRPKRVLVHVDTTSDRRPALTRALHLARSSRPSVRFVDVLEPAPRHSPKGEALEQLLRTTMKERLKEAATVARRRGVRTTFDLLEGDTATMLIRASIEWRADLLLRSHGVSQTRARRPIGPVDSQLLRRCPCPVWFVTPRQADGETVVVAAVDPDPADPPRHELSVRVVRAAMAVSASTGASLHLVHAWSAYGHQVLASHGSQQDVVGYVKACREGARARFDSLIEDTEALAADTHFIQGESDRVLSRFIERRRTSLVVLGTVARTGLAGLVVGNTAERVLRTVHCSVLALKPAGFAEAMVEKPGT